MDEPSNNMTNQEMPLQISTLNPAVIKLIKQGLQCYGDLLALPRANLFLKSSLQTDSGLFLKHHLHQSPPFKWYLTAYVIKVKLYLAFQTL